MSYKQAFTGALKLVNVMGHGIARREDELKQLRISLSKHRSFLVNMRKLLESSSHVEPGDRAAQRILINSRSMSQQAVVAIESFLNEEE